MMERWDNIHQDTINKKLYITFCQYDRIKDLYLIQTIRSQIDLLFANWNFYKAGIISFSEMEIKLEEFKNSVKNADIDPLLIDIFKNTYIINYKKTKII